MKTFLWIVLLGIVCVHAVDPTKRNEPEDKEKPALNPPTSPTSDVKTKEAVLTEKNETEALKKEKAISEPKLDPNALPPKNKYRVTEPASGVKECNYHGVLEANGVCVCNTYWSGEKCDVECRNHGVWDRELDYCVCDGLWAGPDCGLPAFCLDLSGHSWVNVDQCHGLDIYPEDPLTIESWVWLRRGGCTIIDKHGPMADETNYLVAIGLSCDDTRIAVLNHVENPRLDFDAIAFSNTRLEKEVWHHVAVVYEKGKVSFYVNGTFDGEAKWTPGDTNTGSLYIGRDSMGRPFDGVIQDVRIWNVARLPEQMKETMLVQLSGHEPGLIGYWPLTERYSNLANDHSLKHNDGVIYSPNWTGRCAPIRIASADDCPNQCSGHGQCVMGHCVCDPGFGGEGCSMQMCPGGCSGHGVCIDSKCLCTMGWAGEACNVSVCPNNCSRHGQCVEGRCECDEGWVELDCHRQYCPKDCANHGVCNPSDGRCICDEGYGGEDCTLADCPENCNNHGVCWKGVCRCEDGWLGESCAHMSCPNNCSDHGYCVAGKCVCLDMYGGDDCSIEHCPNNCSNHGICFNLRCMCDDKWEGPACETLKCPNNCSAHGVCINGNCTCDELHAGLDCSVRICPNNCTGHGYCKDGECICEDGWTGPLCNRLACLHDCNGHGVCILGACLCDDLWEGADCSEPLKVKGSGVLPGEERPSECPNECSHHGQCYDGLCSCDEGFTGDDCSLTHDKYAAAYEIYVESGRFYFDLRGKEGELYLTSEPVESRELALARIRAVMKVASDFSRYQETATNDGQYAFRLLDRSDKAIGVSPLFKNEEAMRLALYQMQRGTLVSDAFHNIGDRQ